MKSAYNRIFILVLLCITSANLFATQIEFEVQIPRHYQSFSDIYLSGSPKELGSWEPRGVILKNQGEYFSAKVEVHDSKSFEYKINLGDWNLAETGLGGAQIPNRVALCPQDCKIQVKVQNFKLAQFHPLPQSANSNIHYRFSFYFKALNNYRNIAVYLPPDYHQLPHKHFPVLYALDGNNLFDVATMRKGKEEWHVDETLRELHKDQKINPFIVVGIYNTHRRTDEYLNCEDLKQKSGGYAEAYAKFITEELKPFVDKEFRTDSSREKTYLMGSSFGGSFTLYAMKYFGHVFSKFIAMSPAFWWSSYCSYADLSKKQLIIPDKLWIDMGDREGLDDGAIHFKTGVRDLNEAHKRILSSGIPENHIKKIVETGGLHNEFYWGRRFVNAIQFLDP